MKDFTYVLLDAATEHAAYYKADDRPGIKTDVMNAFYAGVYWATQHPSKLTLALPVYEKRRIVIASDDTEENERLVCVAIQDPEEA